MDASPSRREFILGTGAAGVCAATGGLAMTVPRDPGQNAALPWYRKCLVGIEIGPTGANDRDRVYFSKARGKDWIEALLRAKCEYGVVFMKDMEFAYYNSAAARKCPNLGDRDLLREILDAARPHGLPIVAYCQVQYDDSSWRAHPEWRMKGWEDNDLGGRLCYNSGYIEFIKAVLSEMMAYEVAGFHVDMLDYGFAPPVGCWCANCRAAFRGTYGDDLPPMDTWDDRWRRVLQFRADSNTRFCKDVEAHVKAKRPELSVDFNYHGYPPFSWYPGQLPAKHAANGDFVTAEGLPWIFGHNNPSLLSLFMLGARPEGPVQGVTSRGVFDYHDFTVRPAAEIKWEVMTYLAHGAQCTIVDKLYYDGALEPLAYDRIGEAFAEARAKRDVFGHEPAPEVGLYYSAPSRDWWGRADPPKYMRAFWGAHLAMLQSHIPMGVIVDELVSAELLAKYPVVLLAGTTIVSAGEADLLAAYVREGGRLIVTGLSGVCDRSGTVAGSSSLEGLIGARLVRCETRYPDNYLTLVGADDAISRDMPVGLPLLVHGPIATYEPTSARVMGALFTAHRSQNNLWVSHMSAGQAAGPAILVREVGKGVVVTVPCALDAAFVGDYRMPEHRTLLRNIVRYLNPRPPVEIAAPANVETVVTRDAGRRRLLVHFVAWNAPPTFSSAAFPNGKRVLPPIMEEPQQYSATVTINVPFRRAATVGSGSRVRRRGATATLTTSAVHEVLSVALAD
jgi:hypothetical protein